MTKPAQSNPDTGRAIRAVLAAMLASMVLAVCPFTPQPAGDVKVLLAPLFALAVSVLLARDAWRRHDTPRPGLVFPMLAGFVLVNAVSGLLSRHSGNSLAETGRLVSYFVFFIAASRSYFDRRQVRRLFAVICAAVAVASAYGFAQRLGLDPIEWSKSTAGKNLPSTFGNSNFAGHTLVLTLVLAAYLAAERSRLAMALIPAFALHLAMTHHRAGVAAAVSAAAAAGLLYAAKRLPPRRRWLLLGAGVAAAATVCAIAATRPLPLDASLLLRYNSYFSASKMIADSPLLGYGPANYVIENARFWTPMEQEHYARRNKLNAHPHCEVLYAGVSGGILAAALFLGIVAATLAGSTALFWRARTPATRRLGLMFAAFFCAWFVDGLFGFNLKAPASGALFAVVAGLLDRATSPGETRRPGFRRLILPGLLLIAAAVSSVLAVRAFAAAALHNSAQGGIVNGTYSAAEKSLARAERLAPFNWELSYIRAHTFFARREYEAAADCLQHALNKNPQYLPALIDLAKINVNLAAKSRDRIEHAEKWAQQALRLCKPLPQALDVLGKAAMIRAVAERDPRRRMQLLEQSRAYYVEELACGGEDKSLLHTVIGQTHALAGDFDTAENSFQAAAEYCPPAPDLWNSYEQVANRTGDYTGYARALEKAISLMKRDRKKYEVLLQDAEGRLDLAGRYGGDS